MIGLSKFQGKRPSRATMQNERVTRQAPSTHLHTASFDMIYILHRQSPWHKGAFLIPPSTKSKFLSMMLARIFDGGLDRTRKNHRSSLEGQPFRLCRYLLLSFLSVLPMLDCFLPIITLYRKVVLQIFGLISGNFL